MDKKKKRAYAVYFSAQGHVVVDADSSEHAMKRAGKIKPEVLLKNVATLAVTGPIEEIEAKKVKK